ncbi:MAG: PAS domain-containing protein [Myxococcota bacterium]|nr:PAS domain-containing protein [Myxococcota bacterium]
MLTAHRREALQLRDLRAELALATKQLDALRASEARYRGMVEGLPDPLLVHVDQRIEYANAACALALGVSHPDELIGRSISQIAGAPDVGAATGAVEHSFVRFDDGGVFHAEVTSLPCVLDGRAATLSIARGIAARLDAACMATAALNAAALARSKLEAVLGALPVGVWIADIDGKLIQSNPAAARIWGGQAPHARDASEYGIYRGWWPATGAPVEPTEWALARTFRTGETIVAEAVDIERFDGTRGHVLNSTAPIMTQTGAMVGGVVVMLDITSAREAERERERLISSLEFERGRLGTVLQKSPAFIAVVRGPHHVFELCNEEYDKLVGGRALLGKSTIEALPEIAGQGFVELLDGVLRTGKPFVAKARPVMLARRGSAAPELRYLDFVYQPLVEADGTTSGVLAHGVDVTEAVTAQQRLTAQFHAVPVPTYVWQRLEHEGRMQFVLVDFNAAAIASSRGEIEEHRGVSAERFYATDPRRLAEVLRCAETGTTTQLELSSSSTRAPRATCEFVTFASSSPDLVIVHSEDVSERRKLEAQLRQAQKMEAVGRLAGGIAHDFNNILSVILSYSHLHLEDMRAEDPLRADLEEIHKAGTRAVGLTRQLLAFSRQQVLKPQVLDLNQTLEGLQKMLRRVLGEDIDLALLTDSRLRGVFADPGQLEQVLMNLVVNARDAMPTGGTLSIETVNVELDATAAAAMVDVRPGCYVMMTVTDSGTGMDEATRSQVFEPFFTTKGMQGTGLGLATVFGIVHQSGGAISVSSELGKGTAFTIHLPVAGHAAPTREVSRSDAARGGTETILLVEDDDAVRVLVRSLLRRDGYHVVDAQNGGEAFLIAEQHPGTIHLLITDVVMPRMSGRQLAERLAPIRADMKVLYMSGYNDDAVLRHGVLESRVPFLQKPVTMEALSRTVRRVLDGEVEAWTAPRAE